MNTLYVIKFFQEEKNEMIIKCILQTLVYRNYSMILILFVINLVILENLEGLLCGMRPSVGFSFQFCFP